MKKSIIIIIIAISCFLMAVSGCGCGEEGDDQPNMPQMPGGGLGAVGNLIPEPEPPAEPVLQAFTTITLTEDGDAKEVSLEDKVTYPDGDSSPIVQWDYEGVDPNMISVVITDENNVKVTPAPNAYGSTEFVIAAKNERGQIAGQSIKVEITAVQDSPSITSTAVTSAKLGRVYNYQVRASDPDQEDTLTYRLDQYPTGMTMSDGRITWEPTETGVEPVKVVVSDDHGNSAEQSFNIAVTE